MAKISFQIFAEGAVEYIAANKQPILFGPLLASPTIKLLLNTNNVQTGVKGNATPIYTMDGKPIFQEATDCGRTPLTETELGDIRMTVTPLADYEDICTRAFYNTMFAWALKKGSAHQVEGFDEDFFNYFVDFRNQAVGAELERLIWQGDTALPEGNMRFIDGLLKQAGTAIALTGANYTAKLQALSGAADITVLGQSDNYLFMGNDTLAILGLEMWNANRYDASKIGEALPWLPGVKLFIAPGLNGTGKVLLSALSNIYLGVDGENDFEQTELTFDNNKKMFQFDRNFAIGVKIARPAQTTLGSIATAQTITAANQSVAVGATVSIGATSSPKSKLSYEVADNTIATVNQNGLIKGIAAGTTTILVAGTAASKTITVTVTAPAPAAPAGE